VNATTAATETHLPAPRVIEPPRRGWSMPSFVELWSYRDLLYFLIKRDVAVTYKQAAIGVLWAVLRPAALAVVFSVFLGSLLDAPSEGVPYPAFVITGLTVWMFFATAVSRSSGSTIENSALIQKVYFPRVLVPLAAALAPTVDLAVSFVVLEVVLLLYGLTPQLDVLILPLVVLITLATAFGAGLWLSALAARYRDIQLLVPFLLQILLFASAVFFPVSLLPEHLQTVYALNPLVGIMESYRVALLPVGHIDAVYLLFPAGISVILIVTGLMYFNRAEQTMADVI
jgi:lipopolysaccharide transport system permease protein